MIGFGQDNYVTFLDGESVKKDSYINECMESVRQSVNKKMYKNEGLDYCNCWLDKLSKKYTFSEFQFDVLTASGTAENFEETAYQLYKNPKILEVTRECMQDSTIVNVVNNMEISSKEMLALHIVQCKDEIKANSSLAEYNEFEKLVNVDNYCECIVKNAFKEFTVKEMDIDLVKAEKIQEECISASIKN